MDNDRVLGAVSLCRRAGKLALGFDNAVNAIQRGTWLVLLAQDASERTARNIRAMCGEATPVVALGRTQEQIEMATGRKFAVAAVCDENFARLISQKIREEAQ